MKIVFRATTAFLDEVRTDLRRKHLFAYERVGWIAVKPAMAGETLLLLASAYHPVADEHYVRDPAIGARFGAAAMTDALSLALRDNVGMFNVHLHGHLGRPRFSRTDLREQPKFLPDFLAMRRDLPHGALLLSDDQIIGQVLLSRQEVKPIDEFHIVGRKNQSSFRRWLGRLRW